MCGEERRDTVLQQNKANKTGETFELNVQDELQCSSSCTNELQCHCNSFVFIDAMASHLPNLYNVHLFHEAALGVDCNEGL